MWIKTYFVPAAVFQAVIIGGGYGTGREVLEYVTRFGASGGLIACVVIALSFAAILAAAFAFAVRFRITDYRHFLRHLLGRGWVLYELLLTALIVIVIAVVAAAAGEIGRQGFNLPTSVGIGLMLLLVLIGHFYGRKLVVAAMSVWTFVLMAGLLALLLTQLKLSPHLWSGVGSMSAPGSAIISGMQFAVYNSALIPALIYCTEGIPSVRAAIIAGAVAGLFGALPALLLHLMLLPLMPAVAEHNIPVYSLLSGTDQPFAVAAYFVILMGTVILTVTGVLQGIRERIDGWRADQGKANLAAHYHVLIAAALLGSALLLSEFGIVTLIAQGYGALSWAFFLVFTLPLLTIGLARLRTPRSTHHGS